MAVIVPVLPPKQATFWTLIGSNTNAGGWLTETVVVLEHPDASTTVIVYTWGSGNVGKLLNVPVALGAALFGFNV